MSADRDQVSGRTPLLSVEDLSIVFPGRAGDVHATHGVSFEIQKGETLGIVGESGCGKSLTLRALMGLVPAPGRVASGSISWRGGANLLSGHEHELEDLRGNGIAMVFQDPLSSLNPLFTVGNQLAEVLRIRGLRSRAAVRKRAEELLDQVGIASASQRLHDYPHQFSGGMRQRVMIALALACDPQLLLADEPTTALDVTIQDQILRLLSDIQRDTGLAMIIVSHDLGVIAQTADNVAVMYAGHIVEIGEMADVIDRPRHPYTCALIGSAPGAAGAGAAQDELTVIPGSPPGLGEAGPGCAFSPRCSHSVDACRAVTMELDSGPKGHNSACPVVTEWKVLATNA